MKLTVEGVMESIARRAKADALSPPTYRLAWVRAEVARRRRVAARDRRWQTLIPAATAAIAVLGLVLWKGAWVRDVGISHLRAMGASGVDLSTGAPLAVVAALVLVVFVLTDGITVRE